MAAALAAVIATTGQIAPATPPAEAKAPGVSHCYRGVCHRVRTVAETRRLIGRPMIVVTSHYDAPGIDRFNAGRLTSNGEKFDANDPDRAASADLPDGTELLLRNPENGHVSFVRVNDFGPFRGDRRLDVTRRVAEDLGFAKRGVTPLEVIVITAPRADDLKYQPNRPRFERYGHLGVVDTGDLPQLVAELIAERNPPPDTQHAVATNDAAPEPVAAAVVETSELLPASLESDAPVEASEVLAPSSTLASERLAAAAPNAQPAVLTLLDPPVDDASPPIAIATAGATQSLALASSPDTNLWPGLRAATSRQTLLMLLMGLLSSLLLAQAMVKPAARSQRRAVPVDTGASAPGHLSREALSATSAASPIATAAPATIGELGSFLGPHISIDGEVRCTGKLAITGHVRGRITARRVVILPGGTVEGEIVADTVEIEGAFTGRITAGSVEIGAQAEITADIETAAISIREGARVEATFKRPRHPT